MSDIVSSDNSFVEIACNTCKHYHRKKDGVRSCDAFDEIPKEIRTGRNMHISKIDGQKNDIIYQKNE